MPGCLALPDGKTSYTHACLYPEGHDGNHAFEDDVDTRLARMDYKSILADPGPPYFPGTCYPLWRYVAEGQPMWQAIMEMPRLTATRGGLKFAKTT